MDPVSSIHARFNRVPFIVFLTDREADGVVLVYSIASRRSFARIQDIWQSMKRLRRDEPAFILVGNMSDKDDVREVSRQEGATLAFRLGCQFVETSAKTGENVDSVYRDVVRSLRQARTSMPHKSSQAQPAKHTKRTKDRDGRGKNKKSDTKCVVM
ncbi:hypothetical protein D9613_008982 [Agrocybe pediades]|uniref:small monomeric GTPase n=1 Tax=Agrocybe pediades TaxID=84607 RepID=A0A8H4R3G8_9AGAR|nr:hypothetical protein D9613_008982 [Agrocybe pediades]